MAPADPTGQERPKPAAPPRATDGLGLPQATALVLGTIIGVGVFTMPSSLGAYGPISLVALALTTVGALALALMFASLSKRLPADGGPYAYARVAFGNLMGFSNAWLYWITTWAGNAAIATGWVLYVEKFVNTGHHTWGTIALTLAGLWLAAAINLRGLKSMGTIQLWTSILKFVPLLLVATVGLFYVDPANFAVWNTSGQGTWQAIGGAMALCLFSYIGVESASVAAARVRDPRRNVPLATMAGTILSAVVYLLALIAVFGIVPNTQLKESTAPFADAAQIMTGSTWVASAMALVVIVSGFGALNGWTMLAGEMPMAAAADGLFPQRFQSKSNNNVPAFGIVVSTVLASAAVLLSHLGAAGITVFDTLLLMTGITGAIPYAFSAAAQIKWRIADRRAISATRMIRDVGIAVLALVFSALFIVFSTNSDASGWARYQPFIFTLGAFLLGLPIYWRNRSRMTPPAAMPPPVDARDADSGQARLLG